MMQPIITMLLLTFLAQDTTTSFAKDQWNADAWKYVKLPLMTTEYRFEQRDTAIACTTFDPQDTKNGADYVLLDTDTKTDEGEVAATFTRGEPGGSAPGLIISPVFNDDGHIVSGIGIYVASYTMAVWDISTDPETKKTNYRHMVRVTRWFAPGEPHVLRCRYSKAGKRIAISIDDSDTFVFTGLDNPLNSHVTLVGCHGEAEFRSFSVTTTPTLQWSATPPK